MNRLCVSSIVAMVIIFAMCSLVAAGNVETKWDMASRNMVDGLKYGNDGLKQSILQNIIRFGDSLDVNEAIFEIMRIYRNHENEGMRQLALIALHKINDDWAMTFLQRAVRFEKSPKLRKSICAILQDCNRPVNIDDSLLADNISN
ncbi:MAG: hypothetical protein GQ561_02815 [Calditrichae bacterium]|nr:hypothetical protein [Calditrichia bacterium]NOQ97069.1 hypothetical protein [Calditrichia bacterium]